VIARARASWRALTERHPRLPLACLLGLAAAVRLLHIVELVNVPTFDLPEAGDSILYDRLAQGAAEPVRAYFHSPLYQWFLTGLYSVFGRNLVAVRIVQAGLGTLAVALLYGGTRRLTRSRKLASVAAALYALLAPAVFYEQLLLVDAVLPALLAFALFMVAVYARRPGVMAAFVLGGAIGLAALGRGTALAWLPLTAVWMLSRRGRARLRGPVALALGAACVLAPVALRNHRVEGDRVLLTANDGLNLYIGNNARARGLYNLPEGLWFSPGDPMDDFRGERITRAAIGHTPRSSEMARFWRGRAIEFARQHPTRALELYMGKLRLLFANDDYPQLYSLRGYRELCPLLALLAPPGLITVPALCGAYLLLWRAGRLRQRRRGAALATLLALAYGGGLALFFVVDRYRVAWLLLLCPLAAYGATEVARRVRARRGLLRAAILAPALGAAIICFRPLPLHPDIGFQFLAFGNAALAQGSPQAASYWLSRAVLESPGDPRAHAHLGLALSQIGDPVTAAAQLDAAEVYWPSSGRIRNDRGLVLLAAGDPGGAEAAFRTAIAAEPALPEPYANLGELLLRQGRTAEATDALHSALLLAAPDARYRDGIHARLAAAEAAVNSR
jgi:4-amino-4-deoxy-L-arabinose transferase-like glycosyltransferase